MIEPATMSISLFAAALIIAAPSFGRGPYVLDQPIPQPGDVSTAEVMPNAAPASPNDDEEDDADDEGALDEDVPTPTTTSTLTRTSTAARITAAIDDIELARLWAQNRAALGSIIIGVPGAGRMLNSETFPADPRWQIIDPPNTFATRETIEFLTTAAAEVYTRFPDAAPLRINHVSAQEGGYLPPHSTHQTGRDVDLGFYHQTVVRPNGRVDSRVFDPVKNWALIRAIVTRTDVEVVLVDRRIQKVLYDYAASIGEDRAWLDSLFRAGRSSLVQHARRHRDHFHVRFYNPRAQELGRRVQPLLGTSGDEQPQLIRHRIRSGENLGRIAQKYGVSINALKKANRMRSNFIRAGHALVVPVRGKCVVCPVTPEVIVPPRRMPPEIKQANVEAPAAAVATRP